MADVLVTTAKGLRLYKSVNTPDYPGALVNPDLTAVAGIDIKYWKIINNQVVEMTSAEKSAVDSAEAAEKATAKNNYLTLTPIAIAKALVKKGLLTKAEIIAEL